MRLLDRYLLRELLVPWIYCLSGFLILWVSFDLFSELDNYQERQLQFGDIVEYYFVRLPELLNVVFPVALLLALLFSLTQLARNHELTAMRSAGISLWRVTAPYLVVGVLCSLGLMLVNEHLASPASARAEEILNRRKATAGTEAEREWVRNLNFQNAQAGRIWRIMAYRPRTAEMLRLRVDSDLPDGSLRKLIAERAVYTNGAWMFQQVTEFLQGPKRESISTRQTNVMVVAELNETPEQIATEIKMGKLSGFKVASRAQLTYGEIRDYLGWHPQLRKEERAGLETLMHARLSMPWTCLVVVLIAIPFGAPGGRRNPVVGVAASLVICFGYYVLKEVSLAFGAGGYVAPWIAAWLPNAAFAGLGVILGSRIP